LADYSNSDNSTKVNNASTYPVKAIDAGSFKRIEPMLTAELLVSRFLKGIPLISPLTQEPITNEDLADFIIRAANSLEVDANLSVAPVQSKIRLPFAMDLYTEFMYLELPNKPILSIDRLGIVTSNGISIYQVPADWIDTANFADGRVNVIPLSPALGTFVTPSAQAGGAFLVLIGYRSNMPAYWEVQYTSGFSFDSKIPMILNEAIGRKAAILLFNLLIPQFQFSSFSLGLDGVSQSQTIAAPQLYAMIRDLYIKEYDDIVTNLKHKYNQTMIVGMI